MSEKGSSGQQIGGPMTVHLVYATFPDRETAESIGTSLVEEGLAACVTFWSAGSVYRWEGEVTSEEEALAFFKTAPDRVVGLTDAIEDRHPYDVPCVLAIDVDESSESYGGWVEDVTRPRGG